LINNLNLEGSYWHRGQIQIKNRPALRGLMHAKNVGQYLSSHQRNLGDIIAKYIIWLD